MLTPAKCKDKKAFDMFILDQTKKTWTKEVFFEKEKPPMMVGFPSESHGDESAFWVRIALLSVNELAKFSAPRFKQKFLVQINTEKNCLVFSTEKKDFDYWSSVKGAYTLSFYAKRLLEKVEELLKNDDDSQMILETTKNEPVFLWPFDYVKENYKTIFAQQKSVTEQKSLKKELKKVLAKKETSRKIPKI